MGRLLLYHASNTQRRHDFMAALSKVGVRLEQWSLKSQENISWISSNDILTLYRAQIDQIKLELGLNNADLVSVEGAQHSSISLRDKHLSEHIHDEDEVRFFLAGEALLFVNLDGCIHALHCIPGDFILVPKGIRHWMDMGPKPCYQYIRWFNTRSALVNLLTGSYIAESTPRWEALLGKSLQEPCD